MILISFLVILSILTIWIFEFKNKYDSRDIFIERILDSNTALLRAYFYLFDNNSMINIKNNKRYNFDFLFQANSLDLIMKGKSNLIEYSEINNLIVKTGVCEMLDNIIIINNINCIALIGGHDMPFYNFKKELIDSIRYIDEYGFEDNQDILLFIKKGIFDIYSPLTIHIIEIIVNKRYKVDLDSDYNQAIAFELSFIILIVIFGIVNLKINSNMIFNTMENVSGIIDLVPFKNDNDIDAIDRFLNTAEAS